MNWLFRQNLPAFLRDIVERYAWWTVAVTFLITILFALALPQLRFENAPGKLDLPSDDPVRVERDQFESRFGGGQALMIGLHFNRPVDAPAVRLVRELTEKYKSLGGVQSVYSLSTAAELSWIPTFGVKVLRPTPLLPASVYSDEATVDQPVIDLSDHPHLREQLLSPDRRSTAIILSLNAQPSAGSSGLAPLKALVDSLKSLTGTVVDRHVTVSYVGTPTLNIALQAAMRRDLLIFGPLSAAAFVIILVFIFRSFRPILSGLLTSLFSLIWSLGFLAVTGTPISISLSMIIPLVLSLSLAYAVHHLACVFRSEDDTDRRSRIIRCWRSLIVPGLLCGFTTCVGFLSLAISRLPGIREVGLFVGCGVVFSVLLANLFLPALLTVLPQRPGRNTGSMGARFVARLVPKIQGLILPRPGLFVAVVGVLAIAAALGIWRLRVETNHLEYLSRDAQTTQAFQFMNTNFGGVLPMEILVNFPVRHGGTAVPLIADFEDSLRAVDGVGAVISAADFIVQADRSRPPGIGPFRPPLRLDREFVPPQIWKMVTRTVANGRYVDRADSMITLRVSSRVHIVGSDQLRATLNTVKGLLHRRLSGYNTTVTGMAPYFARVAQYVISTQVYSSVLALVVVVLLLAIIGGSLRMGFAVITVNVLPVVVVLGVMGWLDVPLDISTVMIAAIALGIVVDDTIHVIYSYRRQRFAGKDVAVGLHGAFSEVGLPVLSTTIILAVGFGSLLPARFVPTAYFGGLSALTILVAAVADMLLLPALILVLYRRSDKR